MLGKRGAFLWKIGFIREFCFRAFVIIFDDRNRRVSDGDRLIDPVKLRDSGQRAEIKAVNREDSDLTRSIDPGWTSGRSSARKVFGLTVIIFSLAGEIAGRRARYCVFRVD